MRYSWRPPRLIEIAAWCSQLRFLELAAHRQPFGVADHLDRARTDPRAAARGGDDALAFEQRGDDADGETVARPDRVDDLLHRKRGDGAATGVLVVVVRPVGAQLDDDAFRAARAIEPGD